MDCFWKHHNLISDILSPLLTTSPFCNSRRHKIFCFQLIYQVQVSFPWKQICAPGTIIENSSKTIHLHWAWGDSIPTILRRDKFFCCISKRQSFSIWIIIVFKNTASSFLCCSFRKKVAFKLWKYILQTHAFLYIIQTVWLICLRAEKGDYWVGEVQLAPTGSPVLSIPAAPHSPGIPTDFYAGQIRRRFHCFCSK